MSKINLYHGDCMEAMKGMKDKQYELAIVDPPYGIGAANKNFIRQGKQTGKSLCVSGLNYTPKDWDKAPELEYFNQLVRVSKNQIVWGGNYFDLGSASCYIVWDKENGDNLYADCELAWTSFKSAVRKVSIKWHGMLQHDMKNKEGRIHPTQKPVKLYKWLLKNYAKEGDKILDTHGGSMSIAPACHDMGFDLDLWEIDPDYYAAGVKRFNNHKAQLGLFTNITMPYPDNNQLI
jgi:site-specific DNA-methyltransferase (adenine-specific)